MPSVCKELLFILFADDTNILYSNSDIVQLMNTVNSELAILSDWFKANRLSLNVQKTNYIMFGYKNVPPSNGSQDLNFDIKIENVNILRVEFTKFLGVIIDFKLTWQRHINNIALKISKSLSILSRLRYKLPKNCLLSLYYSLIYPHLSYCIIIWGCASKTLTNKLLILQKLGVRIIDKANYYKCHTDPIYTKLKLLKVTAVYFLSCCLFIYKFKSNMLPEVCSSLLTLNTENNMKYNLRHVHCCEIPSCRTSFR